MTALQSCRKPPSGQCSTQMCNVPACILRSHEQQIKRHHKQSHIFQAYRTDKQELYRIIRFTYTYRHHNGQHRSRSTQQIGRIHDILKIRKHIICQHIKQATANTSQKIKSAQVLRREKSQKQTTEPEQPQHIKQDVQHTGMHEHVSNQRPGPTDKNFRPCRQFQIVHPWRRRHIEQSQKNLHQCHCQKHRYVHIHQTQHNVSLLELSFQISNKSVRRHFSFSNKQSVSSRTTYLPGERNGLLRRCFPILKATPAPHIQSQNTSP